MKKIMCALIMASGLLSTTAGAAVMLNGEIDTPNQLDVYEFSVNSTSVVNLYTNSSWPFDPLLTLWTASVAAPSDWQLVASNDNRSGSNFFETTNPFDAKINQSLSSGVYLVTVSEAGNVALGNLFSNGYSGLGAQDNSYYQYSLNIEGDVTVPLPSTLLLVGAGALGFLRYTEKKSKTGPLLIEA